MKYTAKQIAKFLNGEIDGDPKVKVQDIAKIEEGKKGSLSFLANPKYTPFIYETESSIVLVNRDFKPEKPINATLIKVDNAYESFARLLELVNASLLDKKGIETPSYISKTAKIGSNLYLGAFSYLGENVRIGKNCKIYPQVFIGDNVVIGDNVTIYAGVKIYHACQIGNACVIHAGVVIGADGFGFAQDLTGNHKKVQQIGNVILEDNVEVGANTCIDRATMGSTIIRNGVKLDNLIQIGHNVVVGKHSVAAAQVGISGSTKIGEYCMFGGQVGIAGHLHIGDKVMLGAQAGVPNHVKSGEKLLGSPAVPFMDYKRSFILQKQLPKMRDEIQALKKEIQDLRDSKS
jgi:UDP-3-O-[3-hydroxymyristoyl] glucosamine N-acyltransferase